MPLFGHGICTLKFAPCGLHYYDSHQVRSGTDCTKSNKRAHDTTEVHFYFDEFGTMLKTIVNHTSKMDDIYLAITKV